VPPDRTTHAEAPAPVRHRGGHVQQIVDHARHLLGLLFDAAQPISEILRRDLVAPRDPPLEKLRKPHD